MSLAWDFLEGVFEVPERIIDGLGEGMTDVIDVCCTPLSFDWAASLATAFQGVAIGIVAVIVVVRGILTGILLEGGSEDESVGHYLFTSLMPVTLIAACPAVTNLISRMVTNLTSTFINGSSVGSALVDSWVAAAKAAMTTSSVTSGGGPAVLVLVFVIVSLYYMVCISMSCLKRWVQLSVLSVIMPLVAIMTAMEDNGDYIALLKSMAFTGVITVLQIAALCSVGGLAALGAQLSPGSATGAMFLVVAGLGAVKQIPTWIEKYTGVSGVSGRGGGASRLLLPVRMAASQVTRAAAAR